MITVLSYVVHPRSEGQSSTHERALESQ